MKRSGIIITVIIIIVVILVTVFFVNQNQSKKAVVLTVSHTQPTAVITEIPTTAGESATVTPAQTATPVIHHIIITATPEPSTTKPTEEPTPTP